MYFSEQDSTGQKDFKDNLVLIWIYVKCIILFYRLLLVVKTNYCEKENIMDLLEIKVIIAGMSVLIIAILILNYQTKKIKKKIAELAKDR